MSTIKFNRRDFVKVGAIVGSAGLIKENLFAKELAKTEKSVIFVFLGGGISHRDAFNVVPQATEPYRPMVGSVATAIDGLHFGAPFSKLASLAKNLSVVQCFNHTTADHSQGTFWINTGYVQGGVGQTHPSIGSAVSSVLGAVNKQSGMPTYIKTDNVEWDGAAWLGSQHNPFDINGDGKKNLELRSAKEELDRRARFLAALDQFQPDNKEVKQLNEIKNEAYDILLGKASKAFDITDEPQNIKDAYGKGFGEKLLLARRLIDFGSRFVTVGFGGWDMHQNLVEPFNKQGAELDNGLAALINDLYSSGKLNKTLIVISSEFGRTKVNTNAGRDHFPGLNTLLFAGGTYSHGRVIGKMDKNADEPIDNLIYHPVDMLATIFDHLEIPANIQKTDTAGRPRYLNEHGKNILL